MCLKVSLATIPLIHFSSVNKLYIIIKDIHPKNVEHCPKIQRQIFPIFLEKTV